VSGGSYEGRYVSLAWSGLIPVLVHEPIADLQLDPSTRVSKAMHGLVCNAICSAVCYVAGMAQLVTRVDDRLAAAVDELVEAGVFASRSEAVRLGLERLVDRCRRDEIGSTIARGYRDRPQDEAEVAWADESSMRMIAEEPW
jgi:Arc/MetJ-type ribon-helix-helix transcriptional regulator